VTSINKLCCLIPDDNIAEHQISDGKISLSLLFLSPRVFPTGTYTEKKIHAYIEKRRDNVTQLCENTLLLASSYYYILRNLPISHKRVNYCIVVLVRVIVAYRVRVLCKITTFNINIVTRDCNSLTV